jgi:hypothetical protein
MIGVFFTIVLTFVLVLIIICLMRLIKYLGSATVEQKKMRMEVGKLNEEIRLFREDNKENDAAESE